MSDSLSLIPPVVDAACKFLSSKATDQWIRLEDNVPITEENAVGLLVKSGLCEARANGVVLESGPRFRCVLRVSGAWKEKVSEVRDWLPAGYASAKIQVDSFHEIRATNEGAQARSDLASDDPVLIAVVRAHLSQSAVGPGAKPVVFCERMETANSTGPTIAAAQATAEASPTIHNHVNVTVSANHDEPVSDERADSDAIKSYSPESQYARDRFIYDNIESMSLKQLKLELEKRKKDGWNVISSSPGFRKAAKRYSDFHKLPERNFRTETE